MFFDMSSVIGSGPTGIAEAEVDTISLGMQQPISLP